MIKPQGRTVEGELKWLSMLVDKFAMNLYVIRSGENVGAAPKKPWK